MDTEPKPQLRWREPRLAMWYQLGHGAFAQASERLLKQFFVRAILYSLITASAAILFQLVARD